MIFTDFIIKFIFRLFAITQSSSQRQRGLFKIPVQCKCWKCDVGNEIVLQLKAGTQVHSCCVAWMVTTSNFTRQLRRRGSL
ncbi:restriction endonuclease [Paenibacillus polymyxa]|uniref:restriction endonuclease n=1 Tax=Paenibacillus TaxID=44249 RepID=UPI0020186942|nr:restriction endonuclease [Paenibacillus polymyxa]UQQ34074.1 restriction endonuclease [Paenibacillus polymyxa]